MKCLSFVMVDAPVDHAHRNYECVLAFLLFLKEQLSGANNNNSLNVGDALFVVNKTTDI